MGLIGLALSVFREDSIARDSYTERQPVARVRLTVQNEARDGSHVFGISLTISSKEKDPVEHPAMQ